jgi:hypothetical protein
MKLFEKIVLILIFVLFIPYVRAQNCIDHDGGLEYSVKSYVTFYGENYWDRCADSKILIEGYCNEDSNLILKIYTCPDSCYDGKCVSITTTTTSLITTTSTSSTTTSTEIPTTIGEECYLESVNIDTSHCRGTGVTCCAGDRIDITANYSGNCPSTAYLQMDLADNELNYDGSGCEVYDSFPIVDQFCNGLADIDGLGFFVMCSANTCTGSTQLPSGTYAVSAQDCIGKTINVGFGGLYKNGFPCDGANPVSNYAWTYVILGSITFGTDSQCGAGTTTTTIVISTTTSTVSITTTSISTSTSTTVPTTTIITTSTASTIPVTTESTTTTTPTQLSIETIPSSEKYNSCSNSYNIECNEIIRREVTKNQSYDEKDYYSFTLDEQKKVRIRINSTIIPDPDNPDVELFGDYDLYTKWDSSCPTVNEYYCDSDKTDCCNAREGTYDCGPCSFDIDENNNMNEFCPEDGEKILKPGTYYFFVYNYIGNAPYDVNLKCSDITQILTTTSLITTSISKTTTSISESVSESQPSITSTITTSVTTTIIKHGGGGGGGGGKIYPLNINSTILVAIIIAVVFLVIILSLMKFTKNKNQEPKPEDEEEESEESFY